MLDVLIRLVVLSFRWDGCETYYIERQYQFDLKFLTSWSVTQSHSIRPPFHFFNGDDLQRNRAHQHLFHVCFLHIYLAGIFGKLCDIQAVVTKKGERYSSQRIETGLNWSQYVIGMDYKYMRHLTWYSQYTWKFYEPIFVLIITRK